MSGLKFCERSSCSRAPSGEQGAPSAAPLLQRVWSQSLTALTVLASLIVHSSCFRKQLPLGWSCKFSLLWVVVPSLIHRVLCCLWLWLHLVFIIYLFQLKLLCCVCGGYKVQSINAKHSLTRILYPKFLYILCATANFLFLAIRFNFISPLFRHFHWLSHLKICQSPSLVRHFIPHQNLTYLSHHLSLHFSDYLATTHYTNHVHLSESHTSFNLLSK